MLDRKYLDVSITKGGRFDHTIEVRITKQSSREYAYASVVPIITINNQLINRYFCVRSVPEWAKCTYYLRGEESRRDTEPMYVKPTEILQLATMTNHFNRYHASIGTKVVEPEATSSIYI